MQIVSAILGSIGLPNFASGSEGGIDVRVNSAVYILILFSFRYCGAITNL